MIRWRSVKDDPPTKEQLCTGRLVALEIWNPGHMMVHMNAVITTINDGSIRWYPNNAAARILYPDYWMTTEDAMVALAQLPMEDEL